MESVVNARSKATQITLNADELTPEKLKAYQAAQGEVGSALSRLLAVTENYPELKASDNFMQLQRALNETEEQLSAARRTYNACVTDYNNMTRMFPSNLVAKLFNFKEKEVLAIPEAERDTPDVKRLFRS